MTAPFRILITDVAASLDVRDAAGQSAARPLLLSLAIDTAVRGPFTGDPDDIALTVDYSRIVRFILNDAAARGPFPDTRAVAALVADYALALDARVLTVQIDVRAADGSVAPATLELGAAP